MCVEIYGSFVDAIAQKDAGCAIACCSLQVGEKNIICQTVRWENRLEMKSSHKEVPF